MLIDGECWTFELPQFHDSQVIGWGPGRVGVFEQHPWSAKSVAYWQQRMDRHERTLRRWGWVQRLEVPLWTWSRVVVDWGDDDEEIMGRAWVRTTLGRILARRLIYPEPTNRGSHLVQDNRVESVALIGTHGVTMVGTICIGGERTGLSFGLPNLPA
jgi:hypothetical protein